MVYGSSLKVLAVVPARYASQRLPAKPLADILGKPMIQWVVESAQKAKSISRVIVATDHEKIAQVVRAFGGEVMMTDPDLPSGTDRVAAVADQIVSDIYINIQGDEPLMVPEAIEEVITLIRDKKFEMSTVMTPLRTAEELNNLAVVKVLADSMGKAIYFSRYPIPYSRGPLPSMGESFICHRHVGLYGYTRDMLFKMRALPASKIEKAESLEQLRAMEAGVSIGISEVDFESIGVDTPEELEKVRIKLKERGKNG